MKNTLVGTFIFLLCITAISCSKYRYINGDKIVIGTAWLNNPGSGSLTQTLPSIPIFLNEGTDSSTYIYQTVTDSTGKFTLPVLKENYSYTAYSSFIKNGIAYYGAIKIDPKVTNVVALNVYPKYINGMTITLTDSLGGDIKGVHFRLYGSKVAAITDSKTNAFADTLSDANGQFIKYNVTPANYYIVVKDSIGSMKFNVLDSILVASSGITPKTVQLHH